MTFSSLYSWFTLSACSMPRGVRCSHAASSNRLLEKNFGYHTLVLMAKQMTVEERYAPDDGIGEVHHEIDIRSDEPNY
jgi:hypothetical protein